MFGLFLGRWMIIITDIQEETRAEPSAHGNRHRWLQVLKLM